MKHLRLVATVVLSTFIACSLVSTGYAQQQQPAATLPQTPATLKLTVVLSRVNGDKKIANLPFVLMVVDGERERTTVQMSSDVPIPTMIDGKSGYTYRSIGTNMSAIAFPAGSSPYNIALNISDSQMLSDGSSQAQGRAQNFTSSTHLILRDGQTIQYNAATDKATGDVVKVDVTLNVIK